MKNKDGVSKFGFNVECSPSPRPPPLPPKPPPTHPPTACFVFLPFFLLFLPCCFFVVSFFFRFFLLDSKMDGTSKFGFDAPPPNATSTPPPTHVPECFVCFFLLFAISKTLSANSLSRQRRHLDSRSRALHWLLQHDNLFDQQRSKFQVQRRETAVGVSVSSLEGIFSQNVRAPCCILPHFCPPTLSRV